MGRKSRRGSSPTYVRTLQDAEHLAAAAMRQWGYADAKASPGGADRGIDVRAKGALAQVKHHAARVGRPDIQRFIGATFDQSRAQLFFFSAGGYSAAAIEEATRRGIALFTYSVDRTMTTINLPAREVVKKAGRRRSRPDNAAGVKPTAWGRVEDADRRLEDWRRKHTEAGRSDTVTAAMYDSRQQADQVLQRMGNWRDKQSPEWLRSLGEADRQMAFVGRYWRWLLGSFLFFLSVVNLVGNDEVAAGASVGEIAALVAIGIVGLTLVVWNVKRRQRRPGAS